MFQNQVVWRLLDKTIHGAHMANDGNHPLAIHPWETQAVLSSSEFGPCNWRVKMTTCPAPCLSLQLSEIPIDPPVAYWYSKTIPEKHFGLSNSSGTFTHGLMKCLHEC
eukprot:TRINITY_DN7196_c0_g1_i2.p1 TRINITY_DN7196_c0_g1~~TRINITY_DN7196_c0_g1_i2.p1  ORF type:complete len:108 (-),score=16.25 TRINITY_DN7196_c0_g1_i2:892-1215(-)